MERKKPFEFTSFSLHILAMVCMLCDHLWGTVVPGNEWLTCVGRIAFPIFAFMIAEGYCNTSNLRKYATRLFVFALVSEIPFNLAISGRLFNPLHQNVLWTFLIAIWMMHLNSLARQKGGRVRKALTCMGTFALGSLLGLITMVDYFHVGVMTVLVFYFFRGRNWAERLLQLAALWYLNCEVLGGLVYEFELAGRVFTFHQQGFALLALIPIWLYRGKQGPYGPGIRRLYYWFYPAHLLILALIRMMI